MCQFFSCLVTRDHRVLFCEDDSHEELIRRAGFNDHTTDIFLRSWVRVEVVPTVAGWGSVKVDETSTPSWWNPIEDSDRVIVIAEVVRLARAAHHEAARLAQAAYVEVVRPARAAYV